MTYFYVNEPSENRCGSRKIFEFHIWLKQGSKTASFKPSEVTGIFSIPIIGPGYLFLDNSNFKILNFLRRDNWKKSKNRYPGPIIHIIRFEIWSNLSNSFIDFFKMPLISAVSMIMVWFKQYLDRLKFLFPFNVINCR